MTNFVRTGSDVFKQLYIYGALDLSPTVLNRPAFGYRWGAAGWIIFSFLRSIGRDGLDRLTQRMLSELPTTFASHYTDRKSVVKGKCVSVSVDLGGRRIINKKNNTSLSIKT